MSRETAQPQELDTVYLAGGCFWGMQAFFEEVDGVVSTEVGYANGTLGRQPSYEEVCTGETGFAETLQVVYDAGRVPLSFILERYFTVINPTTLNRQGADQGTQYRTGIYYTKEEQRPIIEKALTSLQQAYADPIVVECKPLDNYYPAEQYHQEYLRKNPGGYCHIGRTQIARESYVRYVDHEALRKRLTPMQYHVTQEAGTEPPFDNEYYDLTEAGIYVDVVSGKPLFLSLDKFDSGCGWPAFAKPIDDQLIKESTDRSHGMVRTEVRSKDSNAHLGHLFEDGPAELGGLRYCINSAALRFIPLDSLEAEGYGDYLRYFKK